MTGVKAEIGQGVPPEEVQVALLMGLLFRRVSGVFGTDEWGGLRQSHIRVISAVGEGGSSVTELADRLGMTKQGCGQFVSSLVALGQLETEPDPADRRVRLVRRTAAGHDTIVRVTARMLELEQEWAAAVGERRYRTFRRVLEELALEP